MAVSWQLKMLTIASIANRPRWFVNLPDSLHQDQPGNDVALFPHCALASNHHLAFRFEEFLDMIEVGQALRIGRRRQRPDLAQLGAFRMRILGIIDDMALAAQHPGFVRENFFARVGEVTGNAVDGANDRQCALLQVQFMAVPGGETGKGRVFLFRQFGVTIENLVRRVG
ncbi:MAG: hypothetical protein ABI648_01065 [Betaproteobacteria bacterium]|jgi:hypothetical protein